MAPPPPEVITKMNPRDAQYCMADIGGVKQDAPPSAMVRVLVGTAHNPLPDKARSH